jgi:hypothetical protein
MRRSDPRRKLRVNKKSAAKRQLETAIRLWFDDDDAVSIHTLGAAAGELLHHLGRRKGKASRLQTFMSTETPAYRRRMLSAQNFFKHASRDAADKIGYLPYHGEVILYDAALTYDDLFGATPLMATFFLRMICERRTKMKNSAARLRRDGINPAILAQVNRREFLNKVLPAFAAKSVRLGTGLETRP